MLDPESKHACSAPSVNPDPGASPKAGPGEQQPQRHSCDNGCPVTTIDQLLQAVALGALSRLSNMSFYAYLD